MCYHTLAIIITNHLTNQRIVVNVVYRLQNNGGIRITNLSARSLVCLHIICHQTGYYFLSLYKISVHHCFLYAADDCQNVFAQAASVPHPFHSNRHCSAKRYLATHFILVKLKFLICFTSKKKKKKNTLHKCSLV